MNTKVVGVGAILIIIGLLICFIASIKSVEDKKNAKHISGSSIACVVFVIVGALVLFLGSKSKS